MELYLMIAKQWRSQDICNGGARNQNILNFWILDLTRAILESFPTVKLHYTITKYATRISRIRSIGEHLANY